MERLINYRKTFKSLDAFIDAHNDKAEKNQRLRTGHRQLAQELVKIYAGFLNKRKRLNLDAADLPMVRVNSPQLAAKIKCSDRTVRRYVVRLIQTGMITAKVFHGSNSSFELCLNATFIFANSTPTPSFSAENSNTTGSDIKTNCPHTETLFHKNEISNNIIIESSNVQNSLLSERNINFDERYEGEAKNHSSNDSSVNETERISRPQITEKQIDSNVVLNTEIGSVSLKTDAISTEKMKNDIEKAAMDRALRIRKLAEFFWMAASNMLYKETNLVDTEVERGISKIIKFYEPIPDDKLSSIHERYIQRIILAAKYVSKKPESRYIPLPSKYFDLDNLHGFRGTKEWYRKWAENQVRVKNQLLLKSQIRKYLKNKETGRIADMEMFRRCEQRIGNTGDQVLLNQFYVAVSGAEPMAAVA